MRAALVPVCLALVSVPAAAAPKDMRALFPQQAEVSLAKAPASKSGLARLELPPEVLASCRADLSDVRLFGPDGNETAFALDGGARQPVLLRSVFPKVLQADRQLQPAHEGASARVREVFDLEAPPRPEEGEAWKLVVHTGRREFVRRIELSGVNGSESTALPGDALSTFRLPSAGAERVKLPLPRFASPVLRVALSGEEDSYLEPQFHYESVRELRGERTTVVQLTTTSVRRLETRTVLEVSRPSGIQPTALRFEPYTSAFQRSVRVVDAGPAGSGREIGRGTILRVRASATVEQLEVPLRQARGSLLRIEIENGDSPELNGLAVSAVLNQPALVFALGERAAGERVLGTLYFGGGRAHLPRYDLTGLLPDGGARTGDEAAAGAQLLSAETLAVAQLGASRPNPLFDATPALAFAMEPGARLDTRLFHQRRSLYAQPSADGLSRLDLAPEDLAAARPDLGDLRIVDPQGHQRPYLLERDAEEGWVPVTWKDEGSEEGRTRLTLNPGAAPIPIHRLEVGVADLYFDRAYLLTGIDADGRKVTVSVGRLARAAGGTGGAETPVTLDFSPARVKALELTIENGENAPLRVNAMRAAVRLPAIFFAAPAGAYELLVGNATATGPSYDIQHVRDLVLGTRAEPASAAALERNPAFRAHAQLASEAEPMRIAVWVVLGLAVAVLAFLTLRLARKESPTPPPSGA